MPCRCQPQLASAAHLFQLAAAVGIWSYTNAGPDLRTEFCKVLLPSVALRVIFTLWWFCELKRTRKVFGSPSATICHFTLPARKSLSQYQSAFFASEIMLVGP